MLKERKNNWAFVNILGAHLEFSVRKDSSVRQTVPLRIFSISMCVIILMLRLKTEASTSGKVCALISYFVSHSVIYPFSLKN